jgi:hypothetical protein
MICTLEFERINNMVWTLELEFEHKQWKKKKKIKKESKFEQISFSLSTTFTIEMVLSTNLKNKWQSDKVFEFLGFWRNLMFLENRPNEEECGGARVYEYGSNSKIRTFYFTIEFELFVSVWNFKFKHIIYQSSFIWGARRI